MPWKASIREVRDVGNSTGDVTVEFLEDGITKLRKTYNFHHGTDRATVMQTIRADIRSVKSFQVLVGQLQNLIDTDITEA